MNRRDVLSVLLKKQDFIIKIEKSVNNKISLEEIKGVLAKRKDKFSMLLLDIFSEKNWKEELALLSQSYVDQILGYASCHSHNAGAYKELASKSNSKKEDFLEDLLSRKKRSVSPESLFQYQETMAEKISSLRAGYLLDKISETSDFLNTVAIKYAVDSFAVYCHRSKEKKKLLYILDIVSLTFQEKLKATSGKSFELFFSETAGRFLLKNM